MSQAEPRPWPLARHGEADLFRPVPFGADQRGRQVSVQLMHSSVLIGAMPRFGKAFALRVLLLSAAFDATAQLRIFELKGTGDLSPIEGCCHRYASGADDTTLEAAMESLRARTRRPHRCDESQAGRPPRRRARDGTTP